MDQGLDYCQRCHIIDCRALNGVHSINMPCRYFSGIDVENPDVGGLDFEKLDFDALIAFNKSNFDDILYPL